MAARQKTVESIGIIFAYQYLNIFNETKPIFRIILQIQINSNPNALFAQNALRANYSQTATAIQRLSTGVAINSAKDNAAGMAIGENLNSKIRGLTQSISNINDGINLLQTADGGAGSIQEMLQRIRELAVQSSNGSYSDTQRYYLNQEAISLQKEINQVIDATTWNGKTLLNGRFTNQIIQAGPDVDQSFSISIPTARLATMITGTGATTSVVNMAGQTDGTLDEQVTFGGGDAYLTQYSLDGTKNYTKLQGATANDSARGATTGWDGAIYITGVRDQTALTEGEDVPSITNDDPANNTASAYITKYSYDGQLVWTQNYEGVSFASGSDAAVGVDNYSTISTIANNGAIYVVGDAIGSINSQSSSGGLDKVLIKLAPDGTHQWTQQIASQQGIGISTAKDGSIYVSSFSSPTVSSGNLLDPIDSGISTITLQKFSDSGTSLWSKQVQSNSSIPNGSVAVDQEDGSVYLTGQTFLPVDEETVVAADAFLTKLSSDGTTAWTKIIAQSANNFTLPSHVQVAPDGSVYLAGKTNANLGDQVNAGGMDGFVQKYDATGTLQWTNSAAGVGNDKVTGLSIGGDGAVYLSGSTTSSLLDDQTNSTGMETSFLSKIQSDGTKVYTKLLGTVTNDVTPEYSPEIFPNVGSRWTTVVPSTSTVDGTNSLPVAGTGEFISTTVTGTGDLQGTPANTHYYTSEITIDTSAYPNGGTIQIEIQLGNGASAANYDLFADTVTLPSLVQAYDVVPGTTTTLSWTFEAGDTSTYVLAIEGSSGSISDTNTFSYSVTTGTIPKSLTFNPMSPFQTVSVGGLSFTSNTTLTAAQVASAFANLTDGATADSDGEVADSAGNSLGSFSGTLTGLSTSESAGATITTSLNPSQSLVVSGTPVERKTVTFQDLSPFQTVSLAGLSFTPNTTLTAAEVATVFAELADGSNGTSTSLGSFSGTLAGLSTGESTAGSPTITTSLSASESIVVGVTPTALHTLQFEDMSAFQTIRVSGLSFTSNMSLTAAQVASAFANLTEGATADSDGYLTESTGNEFGSFNGTLTGFSTATFTTDTSQILTSISPPDVVDPSEGIPAYQMLEFKDMNPFQTVTVSGLAFTSNTYLTAAQVALAFSDLSDGATADDEGLVTGSAGNVLGTFKGALVGLSTGESKTDSPVLVTSTANSIIVSGTQPIGVDATPVLTSIYLTFEAMDSDQTITVAGLSFTSNSELTAQEVAEIFGNLSDGSTGNTVDATKGYFSGYLSGFSTGIFTVGSSEILCTQTSENSQISLTSTPTSIIPALSNPTLTFFALVPNQKVSVGGLEFTARTYLTATEVASAFANLSEGDTGNSTGTWLGSYNGALQGFNTSANDIADVSASRTATAFAPIVISTLNSSGAALAENFSTTVTVTQPAIDISSNSAASNSISQIDIALEEINNIRAGIGSYINNLMYASDNNTNNLSNLTTSRSTIMDTDYATETANLVKNQIIDQAATAILAQANQESKYVLQLLKKV